MIFDDIIHKDKLRGYPVPSAKIAEETLVLRLLCKPKYVTIWRASSRIHNVINNVSGHVKHDGKRHVLFYVPEFYRSILMPDLYKPLRLPDSVSYVHVRTPVYYNLDPMKSDYEDTNESVSDDEAVRGWCECSPKYESDHVYRLYCESQTQGAEHGVLWVPSMRLSDIAITYLSCYPEVVRRVILAVEGHSAKLSDNEVRVLRALSGVEVTL